MNRDAGEVGRRVRARIEQGDRAAGFVGDPTDDADVLAEMIADLFPRSPTS